MDSGNGRRALSAVEFLLGAAVVIGHNVFHVVPNEVLILFAAGLLSARLRDGSWGAFGFRRPVSWGRVAALALGAAALRIGAGAVIEASLRRYWPPVVAPVEVDSIKGNVGTALLLLLLVWTFAAFGEEVSYRGYLTARAADTGGRSPWAWWAATVAVSVLFGYGHFYKGPTGILDSAVSGLILGAAYLLSGRVLWTSILAHGLIDTTGVFAAFFGFDL